MTTDENTLRKVIQMNTLPAGSPATASGPRIGLLRHFPVAEQLPVGWSTATDLQAWRERYDAAETIIGQFDLGGIPWQACLSSDQRRAARTATTVFRGQVEQTELLRELQFVPFSTGNLRLPLWGWKWVFRLCWLTGHPSQLTCRDEFLRRVSRVADRLETLAQDTLVVSHAGMMAYLSAELRRRGFAGAKLREAKHATAYVYERSAPHA